jgi:hypothetical protein
MSDPRAVPKDIGSHLASLDDAIPEDADRQHAQDPAEGPDPDAPESDAEDVPRVHAEEPAEG